MLRLVEVLIEGIGWMNRLISLRRVFACILEYDFGTAYSDQHSIRETASWKSFTRVLWHKLRNIVSSSMDDHPAIIFTVVLRNLLTLQLLLFGLFLVVMVHRDGKIGGATRLVGSSTQMRKFV